MSTLTPVIIFAMAVGYLAGLAVAATVYGSPLAALICALLALVNVPGLVSAARRIR